MPAGFEVSVVTGDTDLDQPRKLDVVSDSWVVLSSGSRVRYVSRRSIAAKIRALSAIRSTHPQIVYLNSVFSIWFSVVPQILIRARLIRTTACVIAPRGEFTEGALAIKARKKSAFLHLCRLLRMHRRVVWHASSDREAADVRRVMGNDARIVVWEDDALLPPQPSEPPETDSPHLAAIFLGRISPIKGLLTLLESLQGVSESMSLDIYGPEEDQQYARLCRAMAVQAPANVVVAFHGPIEHSEVRQTLERFHILLMPTENENFGHVVAEALSASCPVMIADTTPWTLVVRGGGGIVVEGVDVKSWAQAVGDYAALGPTEWAARRVAAGEAYLDWQRLRAGREHLFSKFRDELFDLA